MAGRVRVKNNGRPVDLDSWVKRRTSKALREAGAFETQNLEGDLLVELGKVHRRHMRKLFVSEGSSGGKAWAELDPDYARKKRQTYPGRKILVADGTMRKDSVSESAAGYVQEVERRGKNVHVLLGTDNELARIHTVEGVRRRLDKKPSGGGGAGRRRKPMKKARKKSGSRKRPKFKGSYEFVKRSLVQRTRKQVAELREILADYFDRRAVAPVREGFSSSASGPKGIRIGPRLGG